MALIQIIYVSDLVNQNEAELGPIVESAVRHNLEDSVTGMLLYAGGNFLQVLEGNEAQVRTTYTRICQDRRHHNISVITELKISERQFANWSMGYKQLGAEDIAKFPHYASYFQLGFKADVFHAKPGVARELLELFSEGMRG